MFQYAVARRLAEDLGYHLDCPPIEGFPGTHDAVTGQRIETDLVIFREHSLNLSDLLAGRYAGRGIVLEGNFLVYDYLEGAWPRVREWFRPSEGANHDFDSDDLVVHWRVGDYRMPRLPWKPLPAWLVNSVADKRPWGKIFVVTDTADHPPIRRFAKRRGAVIVAGSQAEDFEFIRQAPNILLSTSTFSWWAAILSEARRVYYPEIYNWHPLTVFHPGAPVPAERLFPSDQPRFRKIPGPVLRAGLTAARIPFYRYPHNVFNAAHIVRRLLGVVPRADRESAASREPRPGQHGTK